MRFLIIVQECALRQVLYYDSLLNFKPDTRVLAQLLGLITELCESRSRSHSKPIRVWFVLVRTEIILNHSGDTTTVAYLFSRSSVHGGGVSHSELKQEK